MCHFPSELLYDISALTYLSRGASAWVFEGRWQSGPVAVKFLLSKHFTLASSGVREALLGSELSHPNIVATYGGAQRNDVHGRPVPPFGHHADARGPNASTTCLSVHAQCGAWR